MRALLRGPISGQAYLGFGLLLMAVKFAVDSVVASEFGRAWTIFDYVVWPSGRVLRLFDGADADRGLALTLAIVSAPFVVIGVVLTVRRLRTVGWPVAFAMLFFAPLVNLLVFALLGVARSRASEPTARPPTLAERMRTPAAGGVFWDWSAGIAVFGGALTTVGLVWIGIQLHEHYGYALFLGAPFVLGFTISLIATWLQPRPRWHGAALAVAGQLAVAFLALAFGLEGAVCLLMAFPVALPFSLLGSAVGHAVAMERHAGRPVALHGLLPIALTPVLMTAESASAPTPELRAVATSVVVDAPPDVVWRHVVSFPPIPAPTEWFFRAGIAAPLRAEIDGTGVGAVRHCVFTTGAFVEPIVVWDEPRLLRFDVTDQPPPMREWSPHDIHPPHLDGFLVSRQGQFRLEPLPDGRTRLEGTTWYTNRMWPAANWSLWSDALIHAIHEQVLEHIRDIAEG